MFSLFYLWILLCLPYTKYVYLLLTRQFYLVKTGTFFVSGVKVD